MNASKQHVKQVISNQTDRHDKLFDCVTKHANTAFRKPFAAHTQAAFKQAQDFVEHQNKPIILDSGCGTGMSTQHIATHYPDACVIGIDRSIHRISKNTGLSDNAILIQADLVDFWRLAKQAGWQLARHYILYPNPYPKADQLKRRWHAHPVFKTILQLGGILEVRSNWKIYIDEFVYALKVSGYPQAQTEHFEPKEYWTLFEKKYHENKHDLYRCVIELPYT